MHFKSKIKQGYDVVEGYYYYIELPEELLKELGMPSKNLNVKNN